LCLAIAAGCHVAWLLVLPGMPERAEASVPPPPRIALMPRLPEARPGVDVRLVGSPELFALPSARGFSAPLLGERVQFAPSLQRAPPAPYLAPRPEPVASLPAPEAGDLARLGRAAASAFDLHAPRAPAFAPLPPSTSVVLYITWTDTTGGVRGVSVDVGPVDPWVDTRPWSAEAILDVNEAGAVDHVFLEKPTATKDRNAALVRILATLRFESGPPRSSRLTVRYEGTYVAKEQAKP
jgi:hypothetical protein